MRNVSETYRMDLGIKWQRDVVYKLSAFVCFVSHEAVPIPYVQAAIWNLPHPYLRNAVIREIFFVKNFYLERKTTTIKHNRFSTHVVHVSTCN